LEALRGFPPLILAHLLLNTFELLAQPIQSEAVKLPGSSGSVVSSLDNSNEASLASAELAALRQSSTLKETSLELPGFAKGSRGARQFYSYWRKFRVGLAELNTFGETRYLSEGALSTEDCLSAASSAGAKATELK